MKLLICIYSTLLLCSYTYLQKNAVIGMEIRQHIDNDYLINMNYLLKDIIKSVENLERCFVIITDHRHHPLYDGNLFGKMHRLRTYYYIRIEDNEDLLAPHYQLIRILKQIEAMNCELYVITLMNGLQVKRLLQFTEKFHMLNTRQKFVLLYNERLMEVDMLHIWGKMVSAIFLRTHFDNKISISTLSYSSILNGRLIMRQLIDWHRGKRMKNVQLFPDKISNLQGINLAIAVYEHPPMVYVMQNSDSSIFSGLEVDIMRVLGKALNFQPKFYVSNDSEKERWGRQLPNGSFTGLIGQVTNRKARLAIGDLHLHKMYAAIMDMSMAHSYVCLTFLTPESYQDNSWRTLIQPFSATMWLGVFISIFVVAIVFYFVSLVHLTILRGPQQTWISRQIRKLCRRKRNDGPKIETDKITFGDVRFRTFLNNIPIRLKQEDVFENVSNCILLTYSMLMYVSLPRMPRNWPLRILTGWYWIYCILITVTYRASLTAILANPVARVTIDTMEDLVKSRLTLTTAVSENKQFFQDAFDELSQLIGFNMQILKDTSGVTEHITKGDYAYYDNVYFLRYLRVTRQKENFFGKGNEEALHIMRDCVIDMPVAVGLEKNSPLKPLIDKYIQHMTEAGLIHKWHRAVIETLPTEETPPQEALMDWRKIWSSFVILSIGYIFALCALTAERVHFKYIVCRHPLYDNYNPNLYYNYKRVYSNM